MGIKILAVCAVFLGIGLGLRWLVRYSLRNDSNNAPGYRRISHDSTAGAYARRSKELAQLREAELPPADATPIAKPEEVQIKVPETRIGG